MEAREKYLVRIGIIFGTVLGFLLGIMTMYLLHTVGWY